MAVEFLMPKFGEVMEEGKLIEWIKKEGDAVEKGEVVLEIETDKANTDVESTATGIIQKILVQEGETVAVNTPLALIE
jgi:pyruvate/2-oxoglutarate dehydrogenase complex dihydrolipoamide acyltransferase (E2) component